MKNHLLNIKMYRMRIIKKFKTSVNKILKIKMNLKIQIKLTSLTNSNN